MHTDPKTDSSSLRSNTESCFPDKAWEAKAIAACAGLSDPAAALQAAREALEEVERSNAMIPYKLRDAARAALRQLRGEAQP